MAFLGENLLLWLLLALGGALAIGNLLALVRPKEDSKENSRKNSRPQKTDDSSKSDLPKAPVFRTVFMMLLGTGVSIWALASLLIE